MLFEQEMESEDDPEVDRWLDRIEAAGALAEDSWFATSAADRERFRRFRHSAAGTGERHRPPQRRSR